MGRVIPFSQLPIYLKSLASKVGDAARATILDTNILITLGYEVRSEYDEVVDALDILAEEGYRFLATVNTKAEFLEFQRRVLLTEGLLDLIDEHSKIRVPTTARAKISTLKGSLSTAVKSDPERDFVFNDTHLKKIKQEFSAGDHSGQLGWLKLCDKLLSGRLRQLEGELQDTGVEYVSQHDPSQAVLFHSKIDWPDAAMISERSGVSVSDSMILNAFRCSHCPFIVSMDFDVGYSVLADHRMKDAVMPDRIAREFRHYHFL